MLETQLNDYFLYFFFVVKFVKLLYYVVKTIKKKVWFAFIQL